MRGLLLRVGIDKGTGGCLGPIFEKGTFEFIPIPEHRNSSEKRLYKDLIGRNEKDLRKFLPQKLRLSQPHYDPEFETYTYGDPTRPKRTQLSKLKEGDLLIFYSGLEPQDFSDRDRLYVIGYFTISEVHDFQDLSNSEMKEVFKRLPNNAHSKVGELDHDLVIVKGDPKKSEFFQKALPIGDGKNPEAILSDLKGVTGYSGGIQRAIGHWIDENHILKTRKWLENGFSALVDENVSLHSYILAWDTGFAPNVTDGHCTLACCQSPIRSSAEPGDWVIGTGSLGKGDREERLLYAMRVVETLSFDKFYRDERFESKKPGNDPNGDNIYFKEDGKYQQVENNHHNLVEDMKKDLKSEKVLIGTLFWYFGEKQVFIPKELRSDIIKSYGKPKAKIGRKIIHEKSKIKGFVSWLENNYRPGVHGNSRDQRERLKEDLRKFCSFWRKSAP